MWQLSDVGMYVTEPMHAVIVRFVETPENAHFNTYVKVIMLCFWDEL